MGHVQQQPFINFQRLVGVKLEPTGMGLFALADDQVVDFENTIRDSSRHLLYVGPHHFARNLPLMCCHTSAYKT
ncbi:hypothetical protein GN244_ATG16353 [Phytophthora infestans]|uniref:Uncharacterized protein n=1 Tax=Phytophthora infestans TaxID=4787 RepID=A0A833W7J4_PHYIN|nr:hypothetical protein GN244_ATG16353 [Phytophthora infestans]